MTVFFNYDGAGLPTEAVRRESLLQFSFTEAALAGATEFAGIEIDDPDATRSIVGHQPFHVEESACSTRRIWTGWTAAREIKRGRYRTGAKRIWDTTLVELNAALGFRIITGEDGKRPYETDYARVQWLLGSSYLSGLVYDNGLVANANLGNFNEADYRGRYPLDVLASVAPSAVKGFFVYYDEALGRPGLFYDKLTSSAFASTLRLSNVLADVDSSTTFAPARDARLLRNPENVYSGVRYDWGHGVLYVTRQATIDAFFARDAAYATDRINRLATAQANAIAWLEVRATEDDTILCTVELPKEKVNLIQRGHRLQVKFSHFPGYETFTWTRVMRRQVRGSGKAPESYLVDLELSTRIPPTAPGGGGGGNLPWSGDTGCPLSPTNVNIGSTVSTAGDHPPTDPNPTVFSHDGDNTTITGIGSFSAGGGPTIFEGYWIADLGSPTTSCKFIVTQQEDGVGGGGAGPDPWGVANVDGVPVSTLAWSTNGTDWTVITDVSYTVENAVGWGAYEIHTYQFAPITARYWRYGFEVFHQSASPGFHTLGDFGEWKIMGGTASPAAAPAPGQPVNSQTPTGTVDGSNTSFTAPHPFTDDSLRVYVDGDYQPGEPASYDGATGAFTLSFAPRGAVGDEPAEAVTIDYLGR